MRRSTLTIIVPPMGRAARTHSTGYYLANRGYDTRLASLKLNRDEFRLHKNSDTLDQRAIHCLNLVVTVFAYHSVVRFWDNLSL